VPEEPDCCGVRGDSATALRYDCATFFYRINQFSASVMTVYGFTQTIASLDVRVGCSPNMAPIDRLVDRRTLHHRHELTHLEPELRVERKRTIVESGLKKPDSSKASLGSTVQHGLHQPAAYALALHLRINGDRAYAGNARAFIQTVTPHNFPVKLSDDGIETRVREHHGEQAGRYVRTGKVRRETVMHVYLRECFIADTSTFRGVLWLGCSYGGYVEKTCDSSALICHLADLLLVPISEVQHHFPGGTRRFNSSNQFSTT
jgi:hypothetical protein